MPESGRAAVFLDRDGVINEERGYVHRKEDFVLLPNALAGLALLQQAGFALVVVTNQAGIAKGLYTESQCQDLNRHMRRCLEAAGIALAGIYYCPHHPEGSVDRYRTACLCRKPGPLMLQRAAAELGLDLSRSFLVGDKDSDIAAGQAAGLRLCVQVESGHPVTKQSRDAGHLICPDLLDAARAICQTYRDAAGRHLTT